MRLSNCKYCQNYTKLKEDMINTLLSNHYKSRYLPMPTTSIRLIRMKDDFADQSHRFTETFKM